MSMVHLRGENGAELYFARDQLPAGIAARIARGDLTDITAQVTAETSPETEPAAAEIRIAELEAQLAALRAAAAEHDSSVSPEPEPAPVPAPAVQQPTRKASQADWAAYAVSQGMSPDEAAATSRADLITMYATPSA